MEARKSLERAEAIEGGPLHVLDLFARRAAVLIAVLAGLLAVSNLLSGEAVKESINNQTRAALTRTLAETNAIKSFVATGNARELGCWPAPGPLGARPTPCATRPGWTTRSPEPLARATACSAAAWRW